MASSAMEIRSPAVSSMSSSRPGGSSVIWLARSSSSSVVSPIAETTTTTSSPFFLAATIRSATRFMCAADATEDPPYFWTTRATGPQATDVRGGPVVASRHAAGCDHRMDEPEQWLLSAEERGNPAHGAARLDGGQPRRAAAARQHLLRPAGRGGAVAERRRPPVLHRLAGRSRRAAARRGPDGRRAVHRGGQARRVRPRAGLALAHGPAVAEQGGQPRPRPRDRARRRRGDPRPADPPDGQPPPEAGRPAARRGRRRRTSRSSAGSTSATAAATTPTTAATRRPLPMAAGLRAEPAVARRPAADPRTGRRTCSTPSSASAGTTPTAPTRTTRSPGSTTSCTTRRLHADPLPPQLPAAAGVRAALRADPADLSGDPPALRLRARWRAVGGPRLHEGDQAGPAADLPRGPVHVVGRRRPAVRRGADGAPRPAPGRRRARGSPTRRARSRERPELDRPLAGDRDVPSRPARTGCTCSTWRTTSAPRSTCTPRSASSTTCGPASAATTSTGARGRTTASCPAPCSTRPGTPASRATRPVPARAPASSPATCGWRWPASTWTCAADGSEDDAVLDPARLRRRS